MFWEETTSFGVFVFIFVGYFQFRVGRFCESTSALPLQLWSASVLLSGWSKKLSEERDKPPAYLSNTHCTYMLLLLQLSKSKGQGSASRIESRNVFGHE